MNVKSIKILNFRNYVNEKINLNEKINIIYGDNAQGKTNILESIFICAFGKSFRAKKESEIIRIGETNAQIILEYKNKDREGIIKIDLSNKKTIIVNGVKLNKLSELLGKINVVLFTPDDIGILKNGPAYRRRFLDMMIGQIRPNYVYTLNLYLKTLEQRNACLRQIKKHEISQDILEIWDEKMYEYAKKVYEYRNEFINKIISKINNFHKKITDEKEIIKIEYKSDLINKDEYLKKLKEEKEKDIIRGFTGRGIHKDDFILYINDKPISIYGSQGQHRTAILSLKLTELNIIKDEIGENPILLLDDFMSELDEKRINNFLNNIDDTQVIITCTNKIEIDDNNNSLFYIKKGKIEKK